MSKAKELMEQLESLLGRNPNWNAKVGKESQEIEEVRGQWMKRIYEFLKGIAGYFQTHPDDRKVFFVTADQMPFYTETGAKAHAAKLSDSTVHVIHREDMVLIEDMVQPQLEAGSSVKGYNGWKKADLVAELKLRKIAHDGKAKNDVLERLLEDDDVQKAAAKLSEEEEEEGGEGGEG